MENGVKMAEIARDILIKVLSAMRCCSILCFCKINKLS